MKRNKSLLALSFLFLTSACLSRTSKKSNQDVTQSTPQNSAKNKVSGYTSEQSAAKSTEIPKNLDARVEFFKKVVQSILDKNKEGTFSASTSCEAFTTLWLGELKKAGFGNDAFYAQTEGDGKIKYVDGKIEHRDKTHVVVSERGLCKGDEDCSAEIFIDPTFVQFIEPGECLYGATDDFCKKADFLKSLPRVLVGTRKQMLAFYSQYKDKLRLDDLSGKDEKMGTYDVESFVSLLYSFGENASLRMNLKLN